MTRYGTHRIVFEPAPRLRKPEKYLAALAKWVEEFEGVFPEDDDDARWRGHVHWHVPVDRRLMDPPWAAPDHQRAALQLMLEVAARLRDARPAAQSEQRVYVAVPWPEPWATEVGVFMDPEYGRRFEVRTHPIQTWTRLGAERSLCHELGLELPEGFEEAGYHERCEEEDEEAPGGILVFEKEIWMIREPIPG